MKGLCHMLVLNVNSEQYRSILSLEVDWPLLNMLHASLSLHSRALESCHQSLPNYGSKSKFATCQKPSNFESCALKTTRHPTMHFTSARASSNGGNQSKLGCPSMKCSSSQVRVCVPS